MPLYEYECTQCHRHVEKIQKFSDPEITVCEYCGGKLERVISAPAIQFKGSGWYVNDYAAHAGKQASAHDGGNSADGKGNSKADPKTGSGAGNQTANSSESKADPSSSGTKSSSESTASSNSSSNSSSKSE